jgi:hypothetical protein
MPPTSKQMRMLEDALEYHVQQKRALTLLLVSELLDDLSGSDDESETGSFSSLSSISSQSSLSSISSLSSASASSNFSGTHSRQNTSIFEDLDWLEDDMFQHWDAQTSFST